MVILNTYFTRGVIPLLIEHFMCILNITAAMRDVYLRLEFGAPCFNICRSPLVCLLANITSAANVVRRRVFVFDPTDLISLVLR